MQPKLNKKFDWQRLENLVKEKLANEKTGHDFGHIMRVQLLCFELAKGFKKVDFDALAAGSLLHDISLEKGPSKQHHIESAGLAKPILEKFGFSKSQVDKISECILRHNRGFSASKSIPKGLSLEAKILCDADRIEALGAIGLIRMICFSQNQKVPYANSRKDKLDESFYGNIKYLSTLAGKMYTARGKKIVRDRGRIIKQFLKSFEKEVF